MSGPSRENNQQEMYRESIESLRGFERFFGGIAVGSAFEYFGAVVHQGFDFSQPWQDTSIGLVVVGLVGAVSAHLSHRSLERQAQNSQ